jgi:UDP-N-acetylmuramate dehydrogenase
MQFEKLASLENHNTMGLPIKCTRLYSLNEEKVDELKNLGDIRNEQSLLVLGGGSNILFTGDFKGTVCLNELRGVKLLSESNSSATIRVAGGENWHSFVLKCLDNGWFGLENLSLIPGKVGACPIQNIGAYGVEIKDFFISLRAWDFEKEEIVSISKDQCEFGYRDSIFKNNAKGRYLILSVDFKLRKSSEVNTKYGVIESKLAEMGVKKATPKDVSEAVIAIRQSKLPDPNKLGNCGSFFKNPIVPKEVAEKVLSKHANAPVYPVDESSSKLAAGWLIDQAGWKGYREGDAGVHKNQALVLVNYGNATGKQIYDLSSRIIKNINEKFGITLEREVNIL